MTNAISDYQEITRETSGCDDIHVLALGLIGETAELIDECRHFSKVSGMRPLTKTISLVSKELGDVCWYSARIFDILGYRFKDWHRISCPNSKSQPGSFTVTDEHMLGMLKKAAWVSEHVKKHVGHGHNLEKLKIVDKVAELVRDVESISQTIYGPNGLNIVIEKNVVKLRKRYPNGFSKDKSVNRDNDDV